MLRSSFTDVHESLPGEPMKLQDKLERMTMTAFERRLLKQWLAANETDEPDAPSVEKPTDKDAGDSVPCTGTDST
jgi:hypothetical protein